MQAWLGHANIATTRLYDKRQKNYLIFHSSPFGEISNVIISESFCLTSPFSSIDISPSIVSNGIDLNLSLSSFRNFSIGINFIDFS